MIKLHGGGARGVVVGRETEGEREREGEEGGRRREREMSYANQFFMFPF